MFSYKKKKTIALRFLTEIEVIIVRQLKMAAETEKWDLLVSYNWKTGKECANDLYKVLTENGFKVLIGEKCMARDLESEMANGVANSEIALYLFQKSTRNHIIVSENTHM